MPYLKFGAGNETRTRDPNLGKVVLYQLSYSRINSTLTPAPVPRRDPDVVAWSGRPF